MLNLDPAKLLVIAVVAIILLGPDKLPQVARQVGGAWRSFNEFRHKMEAEVRSNMPDLPSTSEIARLARSPSALLDHLSNMSPEDQKAAEADAEATSAGAESTASENGAINGVVDNPVPGQDEVANGNGIGAASDTASSAPLPTPTPSSSPAPSPPAAPPQVIVPGDPSLN
jgi:sec-independent protein translocase protein TatB